jgi:hypothetical protein
MDQYLRLMRASVAASVALRAAGGEGREHVWDAALVVYHETYHVAQRYLNTMPTGDAAGGAGFPVRRYE